MTFKYYPDAVATTTTKPYTGGVVLTNVTCAGTATVTCTVPFPAFTPGAHQLSLTATNAAGESDKSAPLSFAFVVVPNPPTGLTIQ